jgi:hypothetical protein
VAATDGQVLRVQPVSADLQLPELVVQQPGLRVPHGMRIQAECVLAVRDGKLQRSAGWRRSSLGSKPIR